ncbi:MAG: hypothetical protein DRP45_09440 [Candidatus Zixiibacteriota bacterium]|nr:MAG: hypothetical protein DRP45_09440 [candidate division Zixibacteria bacterium]
MIQKKQHYLTRRLVTCLLLFMVTMLAASTSVACAFHKNVERQRAAALAAGEELAELPNMEELHAMGISVPDGSFNLGEFISATRTAQASTGRTSLAPSAATPFKVLVLLVDFSDKPASVSSQFFDTLMFGSSSGSVRHYYDEVSYSQIDLVTVHAPSSVGWTRAPHTYTYYVDNQYGLYGTYPQNSQGLVSDLINAVDSQVDFSEYDNDSDGYVDALVVVHTGTGAEYSGQTTDMWSHKWSLWPARSKDGVNVYNYTVQPEYWSSPGDMTIGVYCHELGHVFGLPDLYDTDGSSNGIGAWGIMAYGSWNGTLGDSPAHPSAWSRIQLGFANYTNVTHNATQQAISSVNNNGPIYRLWSSGAASDEHFLVENRQQTGYDSGLPGSGLLIWHIDDNKSGNTQEWYPGMAGANHYLVALEQADGLFQLETTTNNVGGSSDPFPGSGSVTSFSSSSTPDSDAYTSGGTLVVVDNISTSAPTMHADLIVGIAADVQDDSQGNLPGQFALGQNYPNPFNPTTNIEFSTDQPGDVKLEVYNIAGQRVNTLIDGYVESGSTTVVWNGTDESGAQVASGFYFYRLATDQGEETRKMLLLQ